MASVKATTLSVPGYLVTLTEEEAFNLYDAIYGDGGPPNELKSLHDMLAGALFNTAQPDADEVPF